jgi:hypothetical protein
VPTTVSFHGRDSHNSKFATFTAEKVVGRFVVTSRVEVELAAIEAGGAGVTVDRRLRMSEDSLDKGVVRRRLAKVGKWSRRLV